MSACGFSYAHYRDVLGDARRRYAFAAFDAPPAEGPFILLRHDVDFSLEMALPLARLEADVGVRATYFVLPHGSYNPYGDPGFGILREIVALGHRLGLHYDLGFYARHGLPAAETLRREAATLADGLGTPVSVAAEHNPGRAPRPEALDLGPLLDAYSPAFTREAKYLSDSCQYWREGCFCGFLDPGRHPRLQVLVHPIWWSEDGRAADAALRAHTASRVASARDEERRVREHYAGLEHLGNRELFARPVEPSSSGPDPWMTRLAALGVLLAILSAIVWVKRDRFIDREEGQHVLRALQGYQALAGPGGRVAALFAHDSETPKPWYGWPYYASNALLWRLIGPDADAGVLLNVVYLVGLLALSGWLAGELTGEPRTRAPAALFVAVAPGCLAWTHFFNPSLFVAFLATAASAALVTTKGLSRPWACLGAGLLCALATISKFTAPIYFAPLLLLAAIRGMRTSGARVAGLGSALFLLGLLPGVWWWHAHRAVLAFWSGMSLRLFGGASAAFAEASTLVAWRTNLLPLQLLLLGAATVLVLVRGASRERLAAGGLIFWAAVPAAFLALGAGRTPGPRDSLPMLVPAAILTTLGWTRLPLPWGRAIGALLLAGALAHVVPRLAPAVPIAQPGASAPPSALLDPLEWPGTARPHPAPNLLGPLIRMLESDVPATSPSRCGCLPFPPYPVPSGRDRPVVLTDSALVGPENLGAWLRLERGNETWQLGSIPYPLSGSTYSVALDCASAVVLAAVDPEPHPWLESRGRIPGHRAEASRWGRWRGSIPLGADTLSLRVADDSGLCQLPASAWPARLREIAPDHDDFYRGHLESVSARDLAAPSSAAASRAALLARRRLADLEAGRDAPAVLFGELYLARAVAAQADPAPGSSRP